MSRPGTSSDAVSLFNERFGSTPPGSTRARLESLCSRFSALPYENISKIVALAEAGQQAAPRLPVRVMRDNLRLGTGGTCFSLTRLLLDLARSEGLDCHPVMAHMRSGQNMHCALRVEAQGSAYLVDPGYLLPRPLPLGRTAARGETPFLVPAGALPGVPTGIPDGDFDLFTPAAAGQAPRWRYRFSDQPVSPGRFEQHWLTSFTAGGMRSLLCSSRDAAGDLLYLHNHKLRRQRVGDKRTENIRPRLEQAVHETFGIDPAVTQRAWSILQQQRRSWREQKMAASGAPDPVKAFVAMLGNGPEVLDRAVDLLQRREGPVDLRSALFPFGHTEYYAEEMGPTLYRQFVGLERLYDPGELAGLKLRAADMEQQLGQGARRLVNLDPGYLDYSKVVLASFKYGGQKIYLGDGVYADMVLMYNRGRFTTFPWTFPDFVEPTYQPLLLELRALYKAQRRALGGS